MKAGSPHSSGRPQMREIRSQCADAPGSEPQVVAAPTAALAVERQLAAKSATTLIASGLMARNSTRPDNSTAVQIGANGSERSCRSNVNNWRRWNPQQSCRSCRLALARAVSESIGVGTGEIGENPPEEGNRRSMVTPAQDFIAAGGEARQSDGDANAADVLARRGRRATVS